MFPRSFRARLTWFFILIVVFPMVVVSVVLFRLVADSERGKSDARLGQAQTSASALFRDDERRAAAAGARIAEATDLAEAIRSGDPGRIDVQLAVQARRTRAQELEVELPGGARRQFGEAEALGASTTVLTDPSGAPEGTLRVAVQTVDGYAREVRSVTGLEVVVTGGGGTLTATLEGADGSDLPLRGETEVSGRSYRTTSFTVPAFNGSDRLTVRLLADEASTQTAITHSMLALAVLLLAFLALAVIFALGVSRSLQAQIQRLLQAARRLRSGDYAVQVPTDGGDELAELGSEFNAMARQLEARLEELESERGRLQGAIRRVGESFAKNLDRDAVLAIVVQTAVDGVAAQAGRARVRDARSGQLIEHARIGENGHFDPVLDAVEAAVLEGHDSAAVQRGEHHAIAHPLHLADGSPKIVGLISVARGGRPFSAPEQELFDYLASQAAVSIQNVGLHETVRRQAVTDELTGLFNHRRFQEVMSAEVERAKRFDHSLGLVMLDLDDFKQVNDDFGHLQGDQVLREVARVLLDTSREIDEPARYGGEEMAIALPQTDLEGACQFAERVRVRIEALEVPVLNGTGVVRVTASLGAAALPQSAATDKDALVAAADAALYRAKRLGKNRVVRAG